MKHALSLLSGLRFPRSRRRVVTAASLAALGFALRSYEAALPAAQAAPPLPSESAAPSAGASAPGNSAPPSSKVSISSYAWPTELSPQPKEEEWAGATELETVSLGSRSSWSSDGVSGWTGSAVECTQRALREWMRVVCTPAHDGADDYFFGALWGLSGDVDRVSCRFPLASELPRYKSAPKENDIGGRLTRGMGASATLTFQAKLGSALLMRVDKIFWAEEYSGASVFTQPGMLVDVSWALGEKSPSVRFH